jgi:opacity protein-like surface antigen
MPQFCRFSIIDFVDFSVETANLFKKNKIFGIFSCQRPEMAVSVPPVMKHILPLTMALAIPAFGGTTAYVAPAPAPAPTLTEWFIGGSYGQINDIETGLEDFFGVDSNEVDFDLYTLHFGRTLGCFSGFDTAVYLEVGYGEGDVGFGGEVDIIDDLLTYDGSLDLEMIPVTINFSLERNLVGGLGCYLTAGAGYAWTNTTLDLNIYSENEDESYEDDEDSSNGGFIAQATAGLSYSFTETFKVFGGIRWMYLDSVDWADDGTLSENDAFGWEVGLRYNF